MKQVILIAGIGGQGVQVLGKLLAMCANAQGLNVTVDAKYSGNMRGAPSNCTVIISDRMIGNPVERQCNHLVAFTQEALLKLSFRLTEQGTVWRDSTMAQIGLEDHLDHACPACALAQELGNERCANIVMAGFLAAHMEYLDADAMRSCLEKTLGKKPQWMELNRKAFECGVRFSADCVE